MDFLEAGVKKTSNIKNDTLYVATLWTLDCGSKPLKKGYCE